MKHTLNAQGTTTTAATEAKAKKMQKIEKVLLNYELETGASYAADFFNLVRNILKDIEDFTSEENITEIIREYLASSVHCWTILENYFYLNPQAANYEEAESDFYNDLFNIIDELK